MKTSDDLIAQCRDLLTSPSARHRHWGRVSKWIHDRTGLDLSRDEVKALYVRACDFDAERVLNDSRAVIADNSRTETQIDVNAGDDSVTVFSDGIRTIADLMDAAKLDPDLWYAETARPNYWESLRKDGGINPHWQIKATFRRVPEWASAEIETIEAPQIETTEPSSRAMFIPDTQHGFRRDEDGTLRPMHDVAACQLAIEAVRQYQPHEIFLLGDHLDLAPWGKYAKPRAILFTTNATLQACYDWISGIRQAAPHARIRYLAGNHETRIHRSIIDRLAEAEGLRTAIGDRPVLSVPNLLALDSLGVEYVEPYGAEALLWDQVGVSHGTKHGGKVGQLLSKRLPSSTYSWVQGHDHKLAIGTRAIHERGEIRYVTGMCPGTLARCDGAVPGVSLHPNWSQGLGFAALVGDKAHLWTTPIIDRAVVVNGTVIAA